MSMENAKDGNGEIVPLTGFNVVIGGEEGIISRENACPGTYRGNVIHSATFSGMNEFIQEESPAAKSLALIGEVGDSMDVNGKFKKGTYKFPFNASPAEYSHVVEMLKTEYEGLCNGGAGKYSPATIDFITDCYAGLSMAYGLGKDITVI